MHTKWKEKTPSHLVYHGDSRRLERDTSGLLSAAGHILTSPIASSLPTLPFTVLKSLFDASPLTTDDGVLLRRMGLDIGVLHLVLACLSVLSHHGPRVPVSGFQQEVRRCVCGGVCVCGVCGVCLSVLSHLGYPSPASSRR